MKDTHHIAHFTINPHFATKIRVAYVPCTGDLNDGGILTFTLFDIVTGEERTDEELDKLAKDHHEKYSCKVPYVRFGTVWLEDCVDITQRKLDDSGQFRGTQLALEVGIL